MFKRYPVESSIFRFDDYRALLDLARGKRRVLEFGPGVSTLALLEASCERIASCEHTETWFSKAAARYADDPRVTVYRYFDEVPVTVDRLPYDAEFDFAFVDSPVGDGGKRQKYHLDREDCSRLNTLEFALQRAPIVALHDAKRDGEQASLARLEAQGFRWHMIDTRKGIAVIERP